MAILSTIGDLIFDDRSASGFSDDFLLNGFTELLGVALEVVLIAVVINYFSKRSDRRNARSYRDWLALNLRRGIQQALERDGDDDGLHQLEVISRRLENFDQAIPLECRTKAFHLIDFVKIKSADGFSLYERTQIIEYYIEFMRSARIPENTIDRHAYMLESYVVQQ